MGSSLMRLVCAEVAEERANGGHFARGGGVSIFLLIPKLADVGVQQVQVHHPPSFGGGRIIVGHVQRLGCEFAELVEVAAVSVQRMLGEAAFDNKVL